MKFSFNVIEKHIFEVEELNWDKGESVYCFDKTWCYFAKALVKLKVSVNRKAYTLYLITYTRNNGFYEKQLDNKFFIAGRDMGFTEDTLNEFLLDDSFKRKAEIIEYIEETIIPSLDIKDMFSEILYDACDKIVKKRYKFTVDANRPYLGFIDAYKAIKEAKTYDNGRLSSKVMRVIDKCKVEYKIPIEARQQAFKKEDHLPTYIECMLDRHFDSLMLSFLSSVRDKFSDPGAYYKRSVVDAMLSEIYSAYIKTAIRSVPGFFKEIEGVIKIKLKRV